MTKISQRLRIEKANGFHCPECGATTRVLDSRPAEYGWRRRRGCPNGHRFTSYESTVNMAEDFLELLARLQARLELTEERLAADRRELSRIITLAQASREIEESRYGNARGPKPVPPTFTITNIGDSPFSVTDPTKLAQEGKAYVVAQDGEMYPAGEDF